ncbi:MAG: ribosome hibernation-promoting factor, HPF/YfiA family [Saprospiraceae bacterium]
MKVVTHAVHFNADQKLIDFIEAKLAKLQVFFDKIIDVNVFLKLENSGQVRDKIAEIKLNLPGAVMVVKEIALTFEAAIDEAIEILKRKLVKHKEKNK